MGSNLSYKDSKKTYLDGVRDGGFKGGEWLWASSRLCLWTFALRQLPVPPGLRVLLPCFHLEELPGCCVPCILCPHTGVWSGRGRMGTWNIHCSENSRNLSLLWGAALRQEWHHSLRCRPGLMRKHRRYCLPRVLFLPSPLLQSGRGPLDGSQKPWKLGPWPPLGGRPPQGCPAVRKVQRAMEVWWVKGQERNWKFSAACWDLLLEGFPDCWGCGAVWKQRLENGFQRYP